MCDSINAKTIFFSLTMEISSKAPAVLGREQARTSPESDFECKEPLIQGSDLTR
jgi:hypothetical protein